MFFFFSSLMLVIMLLFSPVLQDSTHLSDISSGSGHQYRLDQLGQPEPRLPAQWWGLQSLPSFLHLGLWPSHCYAGRSAPWGQFRGGRKKERKKQAGMSLGLLYYLPCQVLCLPLFPSYSSMRHCGTKQCEGGWSLSAGTDTNLHTHTNTRISVYIRRYKQRGVVWC